ncbi:phosphonate ABC transporter ATP-binding protein [Ignavibacteria bacterium]|nr:phosphonate ABC transporter ATP-binding protein [Bacteroidota bacterium]MCZ2133113.1 phosphonate ABC transporter ATP-binding protein [Bacteroidota bacterium]
MIELQNIHKIYPNGSHALKGVSLTINKGEFLAIIGLSGSGKSTLLRCINRLHQPTSGRIFFNGRDVTDISGAELRNYRRQIGMIFQHFNLIKRRTALDNVLAGHLGSMPIWQSLTGRFSEEIRREALHNLEIVGVADKANQRADALSGGQQQRVAIARSLMQKPEILLADEPVASLDPATSHSVMQYLEHINKKLNSTVVCNLHFLSLVRQYATRAIALRDGEKVFDGSPADITDSWFRTIYGEDAREVEIR